MLCKFSIVRFIMLVDFLNQLVWVSFRDITLEQRCYNVVLTFWRRFNVHTMSFERHVLAEFRLLLFIIIMLFILLDNSLQVGKSNVKCFQIHRKKLYSPGDCDNHRNEYYAHFPSMRKKTFFFYFFHFSIVQTTNLLHFFKNPILSYKVPG